ncbi:MAG: glycosyltransferase [Bacteroidetes bacterium]|nr:MAG: glycosyltransferase [Bacteroidota bacterium]
MKILQLTNKIPYPPKDGGAIATLNMSRGLADLGHEITILGMNTSKHYFDLNDIPLEIKEVISFREVAVDTDLSFFAALKNLLLSDKPYNAERFFNSEFNNKLKQLLQEKEFDIIQLEGLYLAFYIKTIRRYSKAVISLRAHNIEHEIWERNAVQEKSPLKKIYLRILARRIRKFKLKILNQYDLLIPITKRDATQFEMFGNKKPCLVVPAGYDTSRLQPQSHKINFPSVFFIGTLDWFPNQEGLVWFIDKVWPKVLELHPGLVFHVAGRNAPEWIISRFKKSSNINFLGEIDDAHKYITENAVMIAPLFSGSGMRVKIIEGMALGKTIVTTTIGAEGIDVSPGENILIEDHEHEFAARIDELLRNRKLFETIGQKAIDFVKENYDNHRITVSLAEFYKNHLTA